MKNSPKFEQMQSEGQVCYLRSVKKKEEQEKRRKEEQWKADIVAERIKQEDRFQQRVEELRSKGQTFLSTEFRLSPKMGKLKLYRVAQHEKGRPFYPGQDDIDPSEIMDNELATALMSTKKDMPAVDPGKNIKIPGSMIATDAPKRSASIIEQEIAFHQSKIETLAIELMQLDCL
jgi:hypothetical protein